jgi:hypothetical protein
MNDCLFFILNLCFVAQMARSQVLNPPLFNLALNRKIEASATCGEGVNEPELYCKLTGTAADRVNSDTSNLIQVSVISYLNLMKTRLVLIEVILKRDNIVIIATPIGRKRHITPSIRSMAPRSGGKVLRFHVQTSRMKSI